MQYWEALLIKWRSKGRDGLTVPFIVGSQQFLPNTHRSQNIEDLLVDIIVRNRLKVTIKYCITIEDIILEAYDPNKELAGTFPSFRGMSQQNLFLTKFLDNLGRNCEEVISSLSEKYTDLIQRNEVSKNNRIRGDYEPNEKYFIRECFSTL
ncbi:MAG: hypothetical protein MUC81_02510 [Bacteroidia bacterium]|jgi:hypothetical protein|nr:hypothetical protein [Bacteroidia bacterium]